MREMILNQASLSEPPNSISLVTPLLEGLSRGMAKLVREKCVVPILRSQQEWHDIECASDGSLLDAVLALKSSGSRDSAVFLMRLGQKAPLLTDLGEDVRDRLLGCEATTVPAPAGDALVLCAFLRGVTISFPISQNWDADRLNLAFEELMPDGSIAENEEAIDNLARPAHCLPILERSRNSALSSATLATLWRDRAELFPNLQLGLDVEDQLLAIDAGLSTTLIFRLSDLDTAARNWKVTGGAAPVWGCKVTRESMPVRNNPRLMAARVFRTIADERATFEWHARFGSSGRIHLRFDAASRIVEVGYVGAHLPI